MISAKAIGQKENTLIVYSSRKTRFSFLAKTMELDETTQRLIEKRARHIARDLFKRFEAPFRKSLIYEKFELEIKSLAEQIAEDRIHPLLEEKARFEHTLNRQNQEIEQLQAITDILKECKGRGTRGLVWSINKLRKRNLQLEAMLAESRATQFPDLSAREPDDVFQY